MSSSIRCRSDVPGSDVLPAFRAEDVVALGEEATTDQGHGAGLAVETVVVPLALLKGDVLAASKPYKGIVEGGEVRK